MTCERVKSQATALLPVADQVETATTLMGDES